jgi:hypothetical protein
MAKKTTLPTVTKVVRVYESPTHRSVWTFDYSKSKLNPIQVDILPPKKSS